MRKIMGVTFLFIAAVLGFLMLSDVSVAKQKIVTTGNGTKLVCDTEEGDYYYVEDIINPQAELMIPATVDGNHPIIEMRLWESDRVSFEKITHIYFSYNMVNINEGDLVLGSGSNAFSMFPNLTTVTIDKRNDTYSFKNGKIYKGKILVAITPGTAGKVKIGKSDSKITRDALLNLHKVTEFEVEKGNKKYKSQDGVLYTKSGKTLIQYPLAKRNKKFNIPKGVKVIERQAFEKAVFLQTVVMPSTLNRVEELAFQYSGLKKVYLNKNLEILEEGSFKDTQLTSITFPSGLRRAEISSIPVKKLILPKTLGEIEYFLSASSKEKIMRAKTLVIKNPALDIKNLKSVSQLFGKNGILRGKTIYTYKGSVSYRQIKKYAKKGKIKLKVLKGRNFYKIPKSTGRIDTSWYSKKKDKFYISTPAQLAGLSKLSRKHDFRDKEIILTRNLNMKAYKNFCPIRDFSGTFNGKGKKITNLKIFRLSPYNGLFATVEMGEIKNLKVYGRVTGGNYTGGIVGWISGSTIKNCAFKGRVIGYGYSGKICGYTWDSVIKNKK